MTDQEKRNHNLDVAGFACEVTKVYDYPWPRVVNPLQFGDIIYAVNGVEVDELTQNCETHIKLRTNAGYYIMVKLLRRDKEMEMRITTGRQNFRK